MVPHILLAVFRNTPRALAAARRRRLAARQRRLFLTNLRFELRRAGVRCDVESIVELFRSHGFETPRRADVRGWLTAERLPGGRDGYHLGCIFDVVFASMLYRGHRRSRIAERTYAEAV